MRKILFFAYVLAPMATYGADVAFDLAQIQKQAGWQRSFSFSFQKAETNRVEIRCGKTISLAVSATQGEKLATLYFGLQKMGFFFPHPRRQISPDWRNASKACGKTFYWEPTLRWRGFHLHTQHPNEWVWGFFLGKETVAEELVRWLVHNQQNVLQLQMIRGVDEEALSRVLLYAKDWGLHVQLSVSFAMIQQKSHHLLPLWRAWFPWWGWRSDLQMGLSYLKRFPYDGLTVELGSSEFSSISYTKTLEWLNFLAQLQPNLFTKIHVSSNQITSTFGNYNFLPEHADKRVGVQVHTVFVYGLESEIAPMYGRRDFSDLKDFLLRQRDHRPTWYYPETSYFIGMDVDVPLFLTDYLVERERDFEFLQRHRIAGQVTFTSGQEMGYWLMDWAVALQTSGQDALVALGENSQVWHEIKKFQTEFFIKRQGIALLTSSNLLDELPFGHKIHDRTLLRDLRSRQPKLQEEIKLLEQMRLRRPDVSSVRDSSLRQLLTVTWLRIDHAFFVRKAILNQQYLEDAKKVRLQAKQILEQVESLYPELPLGERGENLTSYAFGYTWPARSLHFWEREEGIVREKRWNPFYKNIYSIFRLLF